MPPWLILDPVDLSFLSLLCMLHLHLHLHVSPAAAAAARGGQRSLIYHTYISETYLDRYIVMQGATKK